MDNEVSCLYYRAYKALNIEAITELPKGNHICFCRKDELEIWKAMPFDTAELAREYNGFMIDYEGKGIGRALLSYVLKSLPVNKYPVFLHTQPDKFSSDKIIF